MIKKKITALLRNLQLETISEHYSADEFSEHEQLDDLSSVHSTTKTDKDSCQNCSGLSTTEFTQQVFDESVNTLSHEVRTTFRRIVIFFVSNVLLVLVKIIECSWMIGLNLIAWPLKWNLKLCEYLLKKAIKGICCMGCMTILGCKSCFDKVKSRVEAEDVE